MVFSPKPMTSERKAEVLLNNNYLPHMEGVLELLWQAGTPWNWYARTERGWWWMQASNQTWQFLGDSIPKRKKNQRGSKK